MAEDWGAVTSDDLFERAGEIKPLKDLVNEALFHHADPHSNGNPPTHKPPRNNPALNGAQSNEFGFVSEEPMHWWVTPNPQNKLLPENYKPVEPKKRAPKILKKRSGTSPTGQMTKEERMAMQKRVTFDIERFVSADGLSLDEKRLVELGAKPRKAKGINYRQLKAERAQQKREAKIAGTGPKPITKLSKKLKSRKKSKKP